VVSGNGTSWTMEPSSDRKMKQIDRSVKDIFGKLDNMFPNLSSHTTTSSTANNNNN
jgi:hypothetical protein